MMKWTDKEKDILQKKYYFLTPGELGLLLPNRTRRGIVAQVHYLKKRLGWAFKKP